MKVTINEKEIWLKVSMWVVDENRYQKLVEQLPDSIIRQSAALFYICYCNNCRYEKTKPELTLEDFELFVDECYSSKEGKEALVTITNEITVAITALSDDNKSDTDTEEKKMIGGQSGSLHLANAF